jgi:methionyl-tRNA formyltransferase
MINLHASLLPRWRGAAPVAYAIRAGDRASGVSIQRVEKALDGGPVVASREEPIRADDTRATLEARLARIGAELLVETLPRIEAGARFEPQDESRATWARELAKDDGRIDWTKPAAELERLVRAMDPWPRAFCEHEGKRLIVVAAGLADVTGTPGQVLALAGDTVIVGTGDGALALVKVKPEGKPDMAAAAWARGRRIAPGARLA